MELSMELSMERTRKEWEDTMDVLCTCYPIERLRNRMEQLATEPEKNIKCGPNTIDRVDLFELDAAISLYYSERYKKARRALAMFRDELLHTSAEPLPHLHVEAMIWWAAM